MPYYLVCFLLVVWDGEEDVGQCARKKATYLKTVN